MTMRAFIIRPFGKKKDGKGNEIDFDLVASELIGPALQAVGAEGRETLDIVEAGNIRVDMFRRLLTADIVVADLSIHNANVFYELGIRHALRQRGTLMLRSAADSFPFDLQTDRYLTYDRNDPKASLELLIKSLRRTIEKLATDYTAKDSPVFASLPDLTEPNPSHFNPVPEDFAETVAKAASDNVAGDLALLSYEVTGFEWQASGWRLVGAAQFAINAMAGARTTWEHLRRLDPQDLEANMLLATIYQRLGDLLSSNQALDRALRNKAITPDRRAEAYSLLGRNHKDPWRKDWESKPQAERGAVALNSPHLQDSFENYERAYEEDLNHYYSGLNALALIKIMLALAELLPEVWSSRFDTDEDAAQELKKLQTRSRALEATVQLSLTANARRMEREGRTDVWAEISQADLACITSSSPQRVANAYRRALSSAPTFASQSVRQQLAIYRDLGVLSGNLEEVFKVVGEPAPLPAAGVEAAPAPQRKRVLVFAGHMIDAPDRKTPRFPADKESIAREKIKEAVVKEMNIGAGVAAGYAGGASGGDTLFQEVCAELEIPTRLYLAIQPQLYVTTSVMKAGQNWVRRFWELHAAHLARKQVRVLSSATEVRDSIEYLPAWLRSKPNYNIWQRNNLWMLFNALAEACDDKTSDPNLTLIALWDGAGGDGPGGTEDLVEKVEKLGARCEIINTKEIFGL